jgi:hypothetical protein
MKSKPQGKIQHEITEQGRLSLDGVIFETPDKIKGVSAGSEHDRFTKASYDEEGRDQEGFRVTFCYKGYVGDRESLLHLDAPTFVRMGRPNILNIYRNTIIAPTEEER